MAFQLRAEDVTWLTSVSEAEAQAKKESKLVLLDFTGSDWCPWCIKFEKEVLTTPEFTQYAKANLVPVLLDFPHAKPQDDALKEANKALKGKYEIKGFPTYVLLNADGKEVGRQVGYDKGGPKAFIAKIDGFKK